MKNYIFGYARVSTESQNLDRQIDALKKYGVDHIYNEKITGTKRDRPELAKLLERITENDVIVIESLSRLGRSTLDLIQLVQLFESKKVHLVSLKESIDTNSPTGRLLFTLMSAIAQFERDCIADRTKEGLKAARARGRLGGRPKTNMEQVKKAVKLYNAGQHSIKEIEELTGIKKRYVISKFGGKSMTREDLLPNGLLEHIPPLYSSENIPITEKIIKAKYFLASFTWLVTECEVQKDGDILFFGYVINHSDISSSEWGHFTLNELLGIKLYGVFEVERDLYFNECRFKDYNV